MIMIIFLANDNFSRDWFRKCHVIRLANERWDVDSGCFSENLALSNTKLTLF